MKFAKELEHDLVPEWRAMYLDYKEGKSYVKAIARAISRSNTTPRHLRRDTVFARPFSHSPLGYKYDEIEEDIEEIEPTDPSRESPAEFGADSQPESEEATPMLRPGRRKTKKDPDNNLQYGSFIATHPPSSKPVQPLELPERASDSDGDFSPNTEARGSTHPRPGVDPFRPKRSPSNDTPGGTYEFGHRSSNFNAASRGSAEQMRQRLMSSPDGPARASAPRFLHRMMSISQGQLARGNYQPTDTNLPVFDPVKTSEQDFFKWMDGELDKIETFYKSKEDEAGEKLKILREQLHIMKNRRVDEITDARKAREDAHAVVDPLTGKRHSEHNGSQLGTRDQLQAWMQPIEKVIQLARTRSGGSQSGQLTPHILSKEEQHRHKQIMDRRDYVRRQPHSYDVPFQIAKRKLKIAMKEYYRGLELLKSYALLNRTAFRKINKKYDKVTNSGAPQRYMSEKVNNTCFVQSDVLDGYLRAVEDLYSRYFEKGHHKVAVGKLRSSAHLHEDYTGSAFLSGLLVSTGIIFAVQALILATGLLYDESDKATQEQTNFLLQIYAGYFLALYLFSWFCLDCGIWSRTKINYVFIFEIDPRHHLDWREMAEIPSVFLLALGLSMWLNFSRYGPPELFLYYPVILIFATVVMIFLPAPILFHRSRRWFIYSHWRLLLAGLYPVEFRDFFLGDMYCSLTTPMSNIELFFCLYAHHWADPSQCGSGRSRLLGFLSTLPGIWRALQCVRRYYDTWSIFPHLVNCGKYSLTILYYVTLSLYRIKDDTSIFALFLTFATANAIYCSVWDLAMDWSLCQPHAKKLFLRDVRGYQATWPYYLAMIIDPILRFNWIFYAYYTHGSPYGSLVSFFVAFSEVTRRGMWVLFRVENEHTSNVQHFKASRDVPLPYPIPSSDGGPLSRQHISSESPTLSRYQSTITAAEEGGESGPSDGLRRRGPRKSLGGIVADAHLQDFVKKKKPGAEGDDETHLTRTRSGNYQDDRVATSDEDNEDDEDDVTHQPDMEKLERGKGKGEE